MVVALVKGFEINIDFWVCYKKWWTGPTMIFLNTYEGAHGNIVSSAQSYYRGSHHDWKVNPACTSKDFIMHWMGTIMQIIPTVLVLGVGGEHYSRVPHLWCRHSDSITHDMSRETIAVVQQCWGTHSEKSPQYMQRSKALHLSGRGITTVPGLIPGCITSGRDWESHRAAHNWPSVIRIWLG